MCILRASWWAAHGMLLALHLGRNLHLVQAGEFQDCTKELKWFLKALSLSQLDQNIFETKYICTYPDIMLDGATISLELILERVWVSTTNSLIVGFVAPA